MKNLEQPFMTGKITAAGRIPPKPPGPFKAGDRVAYSAAWLRNVAGHAVASRRGTVLRICGAVCRVRWDDAQAASNGVHQDNLVLVSRIHLEPV